VVAIGRTHSNANELTGYTSGAWVTPHASEPDHDAAGNTRFVPKPGDEGTAASARWLIYDGWNRLVKAQEDDDGDGIYDSADDDVLAEYRYDGLHRWIRKFVPNESNWDVTEFYYNTNWQVLEVHDDVKTRTGTPLAEPAVADDIYCQYIWDLRYIDAVVVRDRDADDNAGTGIYGKASSGLEERLYYTNDANFNVTALVGTDGNVKQRFEYTPYGEVTELDPDFTSYSGSDYDVQVLYAGYRHDDETGLYHVRNRYHHPTLGTWITRDPIGYADGMNLYQYVASNPTVATDPSGRIIIGLGGLAKMGQAYVKVMLESVKRQINQRKPGLRDAWGEELVMLDGSMGRHKSKIVKELVKYRENKDADPCWHEQVVLVGFSDGATSIYQLFQEGKIQNALATQRQGATGSYKIAYLGMIDMVRESFWDELILKGGYLRRLGKQVTMNDGGLIVDGDNFYQQDTVGFHRWKGHVTFNVGLIRNDPIDNVSHKGHLFGDWGAFFRGAKEPRSIVLDPRVHEKLIQNAVDAYLAREPGKPDAKRNPLVD